MARGTIERVKVHCRLRPLLAFEREEQVAARSDCSNGDVNKTVSLRNESFTFDSFFGASSTQPEVYAKVAAPVVASVLQGYNGTIFAYGQTGSGKTHSMFGSDPQDGAGIVPRALGHVFQEIAKDDEFLFTVSLSYVQLYCELLTDLLNPSHDDASGGEKKSLLIREHPKKGVFIEGARSVVVENADEAMNLIREGDEHRARAATQMNEASSRSHACLILNITKRKVGSPSSSNKKAVVKYGKLILVDLAGSERVKKALGNNHDHHGVRFMESKAINLSLSALGNCISALAKRKSHVPYRDAKLTRLLKDSLGGNSMTSLVLNIAPNDSHFNETRSTLSFGQRAMTVETRVSLNEDIDFEALYSGVQADLDQKDDRIHELELELSRLRSEVSDTKKTANLALQERSMAQMQLSSLTVSEDVADQIKMLQIKHQHALVQVQQDFEKLLEKEKVKAATAHEEWHRIEYELKDEREEHLRTCALLREKQQQIAELEKCKDDRIAELFEDLKALQDRNDTLTNQMKISLEEKSKLAHENSKLCSELGKTQDFQDRGFKMMQTLTTRVERLEGKKQSIRDSRVEESSSRPQNAKVVPFKQQKPGGTRRKPILPNTTRRSNNSSSKTFSVSSQILNL